jgi:asparagine N-glycosylation enzyme membrane subunit Stt3
MKQGLILDELRSTVMPALADRNGKQLSIIEAAEEFKNTHQIDPDLDYDWVYEHAKGTFDRCIGVFERLDAKAGNIITYLGGATGVVTLTALLNIKPENLTVLSWSIPSFVAALASVGFAVIARQTIEISLPAGVKSAINYHELYRDADRAKAAFLGQWHLAIEATAVKTEQKARYVAIATWFLLVAVLALSFPFVAALWKMHKPI